MNVLDSLWAKFSRSKNYRQSFSASVVKRMIPIQIRVLRRKFGYSQAQLAVESGLTQGVISRAEDPEYGNLTINTLVRVAGGFDCAFIGRFVPFSEFAGWYVKLDDEKQFEVPCFSEDTMPVPEEILVERARADGKLQFMMLCREGIPK